MSKINHLRVVCVSHLKVESKCTATLSNFDSQEWYSSVLKVSRLSVFGNFVNFVFIILQDTMVARESEYKSRDPMDAKSRQLDVQPKVNQVCGIDFTDILAAVFLCGIAGCHPIWELRCCYNFDSITMNVAKDLQ